VSILDTAAEVVHGDRARDYGHPSANHACTAEMVEAYLRRRYGSASFDAQDVCMFNILQKVSRLAHTPGHLDSLADVAGYAANVEMLVPPGPAPADEA